MISMTFFDFLCNLTVLLIILFTALSYATGLFYIAELAEEFPTLTKRVVRYLVAAIAALHAAALFSALPKLPVVIGLLLHLSYLPLLSTFPVLPLTSPTFYLSLALLLSAQLCWYYKLPTSPYPSYPTYGSYSTARTYSNAQLLAFYLLFVWLVPLVFFVAGSVTSSSLPMDGERVRGDEEERGKGKGGRWSIAGISWWCKRERAASGSSNGRDKKYDGAGSADTHSAPRYEPNPAYYGSTASASTTAAPSPAYQPVQPQLGSNGAGASAWYGQQTTGYGQASSEGEWMGQRMTSAPPHTAVRQRSHVS